MASVTFKLSLIFNFLFSSRLSDNVNRFIVDVDVFVSKVECFLFSAFCVYSYLSKTLDTKVVLEAELNIGFKSTSKAECTLFTDRIFPQTCSFLLTLHKKFKRS